jgi:predicted acetyltransferase
VAIEVRSITASEIDQWAETMGIAFLQRPGEGFAQSLAGVDLSRMLAAISEGRIVATLRSFNTAFTVPGPRQVNASAISNVGVLPTHRRRGLLSRMITADLRSSVERGEAVAVLIAAEYPIYGRFGFGPAIDLANYSVDARATRFQNPGIGDMELVDVATMRRAAPAIYEQFRAQQPGSIERSSRGWDRLLPPGDSAGAKPFEGNLAIYRSPGGQPEGYIYYKASQEWDGMIPKSELTVEEMVAVTPAAYHRIWQFCCEVDWVATVRARTRSVEEPLPFLLTDGRTVRQTVRSDMIWLRPLDVPAALRARHYNCPGRVVLEVIDPLEICSGRYALEAGPSGTYCEPTGEDADITLPVSSLGSAYMNGTSLATLAAVGRLQENRPGTLSLADAMFRGAPGWCAVWF